METGQNNILNVTPYRKLTDRPKLSQCNLDYELGLSLSLKTIFKVTRKEIEVKNQSGLQTHAEEILFKNYYYPSLLKDYSSLLFKNTCISRKVLGPISLRQYELVYCISACKII